MPQVKRGDDFGNSVSGPIRSRRPFGVVGTLGRDAAAGSNRPFTSNQQYEDEILGWSPRTKPEQFNEFWGAGYHAHLPLTNITSNADINNIPVAAASISQFDYIVPRSGVLSAASLIGQDTLTANDTNYITVAITNLLGAGSGSTAMLAATAANTTQATGGATLTAEVPFTLTLNATAANLRVTAGDVLRITTTVTGTLANIVDAPNVHLRFSTIAPLGDLWAAQVTRTAGSPLIAPLAATANGVVGAKLSATNEVNFAGVTFGDTLMIPMNRGAYFQVYARVPTADITTAQDVILGLATSYNSTLASMSKYCWFRLKASMALLAEAADGTTTTLAQDLGFTVVKDTLYLFTIVLKSGNGRNSGFAEFWVDDNYLGKVNIAAGAATDLLQPMVGVRKASGTTTPALDVDFCRVNWDRF